MTKYFKFKDFLTVKMDMGNCHYKQSKAFFIFIKIVVIYLPDLVRSGFLALVVAYNKLIE